MFKLIFLNKVTPLYQDNNNQKEEEECLICLSTLNNKKILVLENCCHKFCYDCIDKWIDKGLLSIPKTRNGIYA